MTTMAGTRIVDPSFQTAFTKQIRRGGDYRAEQLPTDLGPQRYARAYGRMRCANSGRETIFTTRASIL